MSVSASVLWRFKQLGHMLRVCGVVGVALILGRHLSRTIYTGRVAFTNIVSTVRTSRGAGIVISVKMVCQYGFLLMLDCKLWLRCFFFLLACTQPLRQGDSWTRRKIPERGVPQLRPTNFVDILFVQCRRGTSTVKSDPATYARTISTMSF